SPKKTLGTLVAIGRNSPRISAGASGFGSHMSRCDGPPFRKMMMHESAPALVFRDSSARNNIGRLRPTYEAAPAWIIWRREMRGPGQEVIAGSRGVSGM